MPRSASAWRSTPSDPKNKLREARVRGLVRVVDDARIEASFADEATRAGAVGRDPGRDARAAAALEERGDKVVGTLTIGAQQSKEIADYSVNQNLTTLRNRVNELGVSEPLVQRQGQNRIVVELPGIQDTAEAKRILGKVANLEFRLVANLDAAGADKQRFEYRDRASGERSEWLERDVIITGERVSCARPVSTRTAAQCADQPGQRGRYADVPRHAQQHQAAHGGAVHRAQDRTRLRVGAEGKETTVRTLRREEADQPADDPVCAGGAVPDHRPGQPGGGVGTGADAACGCARGTHRLC